MIFICIIVFSLLSYFVFDLGLAAVGLDLVSFNPCIQKQTLNLKSICPQHQFVKHLNFTFLFRLRVWQNGLGPS